MKSDEPVGYVDLMNVCLENKQERRPPFKTIRESLMWMVKQTSYQSKRPKNRGKIPPRKPIASISSIVAAETRKVKRPPPPTPTRRKNQTSVVKRDMEGQDFDDTACTDASELVVGIEIDMDDVENDKIDMMDL